MIDAAPAFREPVPTVVQSSGPPPASETLIYRTKLPVRLWHWTNAITIFIMLMSGMMIFNAHPHLYWGKFGANPDYQWLWIGHMGTRGFTRLFGVEFNTTGFLGYAGGVAMPFPPILTIPTTYSLADARLWHFFFAWVLVVPGLLFGLWALVTKHLWRDVLPKAKELAPGHLLHDIKEHALLRFPTGEAARHYNVLQKLAYCVVLFVLLPGIVLTGLTMSPYMDAAWPWLLTLFGGRQTARSIHFILATGFAGFIFVHLAAVVAAGPINEIRSIITGWYRLPRPKLKPPKLKGMRK
jgi:thiosulfate reductase cytochrome b subunit